YRGRDNRRQKNLNLILSAGLIYLGGGVTNTLLATLRESAAEVALRDAAANGAVIAAIGAAAASFGTYARDMRPGIVSAGSVPALAWLANTGIDTGFAAAHDTTLRRLMSMPGTELGLGIPARTARAIHSHRPAETLGEGKIASVRKEQASELR